MTTTDDVTEVAEVFASVKSVVPDSVCAAILALGVFVVRHQRHYFQDQLDQIHEILETMNDTMIGSTQRVSQALEEISSSLGDIDLTVTETHKALTSKLGVGSE